MLFALSLATMLIQQSPYGDTCFPKDNSARILTKASPNAIHPDWAGESTVGTEWHLIIKEVTQDTYGATYYRGDLISPRGGVVNKGVFILEREWTCAAKP